MNGESTKGPVVCDAELQGNGYLVPRLPEGTMKIRHSKVFPGRVEQVREARMWLNAVLSAHGTDRIPDGQVAAAVWRHGDGYRLFCFRSVARYVMGLLQHSAQPGAEIV